ncbi:MAG: BrnT family toxin [Bryobacteraceae bacterium]|jgi:uncharacterized DUF497 family protein
MAERVGQPPLLADVYTLRYNRALAGGIEFNWDDENRKHLAAHKVSPAEFEQLLHNNRVDLSFELTNGEERYRSVGVTDGGRLLSVAWMIRKGKVRAITGFAAGASDRKAFVERLK